MRNVEEFNKLSSDLYDRLVDVLEDKNHPAVVLNTLLCLLTDVSCSVDDEFAAHAVHGLHIVEASITSRLIPATSTIQ